MTFVPYVINPFFDWLLEKIGEYRARKQQLQVQMDKMIQKA
jgi:hypothetical protein